MESTSYLFIGGPRNGKIMEVPRHVIINGQIGIQIKQPDIKNSVFIYQTAEITDDDLVQHKVCYDPKEGLPSIETIKKYEG